MCNPQQATVLTGLSRMDLRALPTAWFLAEVVDPLPAYKWAAGSHLYVSRNESGMYRVLRHGVAKLVSEGVAKRHLLRARTADGSFVRVSQQRKWDDTWNESYAESRRQTTAA